MTKTKEVFQCFVKKGTYWQMCKDFLKADIEYPFEHGEVINYTLDDASIHPVTKIQASFLTQLPEMKKNTQGFHHQANGALKTVTEFNGSDR